MSQLLQRSWKKRTKKSLVSPFPIPVTAINDDQPWTFYTGVLKNDSIIIENSDEAKLLYLRGYYGTVLACEEDEKSNHPPPPQETYETVDFDFELSDEETKTNEDLSDNGIDQNEDVDSVTSTNSNKDGTYPLEGVEESPVEKQWSKDDLPLGDAFTVLTLEEGFFLSFALGCLLVKNEAGEFLSIQQQWRHFREISTNFVKHYVAYHHFRSKGYVTKPGVKYGVPYVAYHKGMAFYHSSYMIQIQEIDDGDSGGSDVSCCSSRLSWTDVAALLRLASSVQKQLIVLNVKFPPSSSSLECAECLKEFQVAEVLASRWDGELNN